MIHPVDNAIHPLNNDWAWSVLPADLRRNQKLCSHSQEFLTPEKCAHHIILRGLVRVLMVAEVRRVLFFLGKKGIVNHGILPDVPKTLSSTQDSKVLNLLQHSYLQGKYMPFITSCTFKASFGVHAPY